MMHDDMYVYGKGTVMQWEEFAECVHCMDETNHLFCINGTSDEEDDTNDWKLCLRCGEYKPY